MICLSIDFHGRSLACIASGHFNLTLTRQDVTCVHVIEAAQVQINMSRCCLDADYHAAMPLSAGLAAQGTAILPGYQRH